MTNELTSEQILDLAKQLEARKAVELKSQFQDIVKDLAAQRINVKSMEKVVGADYMTVILLYHQRTRNFYKSARPVPGTRPDCASADAITGYGDINDGKGKQERLCLDCPMSQWGSSTKGEGKGQACRIMRFVALHRTDPRTDSTPVTEIMQISPTNMRSFANLMEEFIKKNELYYTYSVGIHLKKNEMDEGTGFDFELGNKLDPAAQYFAMNQHDKEKTSMQAFLNSAIEHGALDEGNDAPRNAPQLQA